MREFTGKMPCPRTGTTVRRNAHGYLTRAKLTGKMPGPRWSTLLPSEPFSLDTLFEGKHHNNGGALPRLYRWYYRILPIYCSFPALSKTWGCQRSLMVQNKQDIFMGASWGINHIEWSITHIVCYKVRIYIYIYLFIYKCTFLYLYRYTYVHSSLRDRHMFTSLSIWMCVKTQRLWDIEPTIW